MALRIPYTMKRKNSDGTSYDVLYPETIASQILIRDNTTTLDKAILEYDEFMKNTINDFPVIYHPIVTFESIDTTNKTIRFKAVLTSYVEPKHGELIYMQLPNLFNTEIKVEDYTTTLSIVNDIEDVISKDYIIYKNTLGAANSSLLSFEAGTILGLQYSETISSFLQVYQSSSGGEEIRPTIYYNSISTITKDNPNYNRIILSDNYTPQINDILFLKVGANSELENKKPISIVIGDTGHAVRIQSVLDDSTASVGNDSYYVNCGCFLYSNTIISLYYMGNNKWAILNPDSVGNGSGSSFSDLIITYKSLPTTDVASGGLLTINYEDLHLTDSDGKVIAEFSLDTCEIIHIVFIQTTLVRYYDYSIEQLFESAPFFDLRFINVDYNTVFNELPSYPLNFLIAYNIK